MKELFEAGIADHARIIEGIREQLGVLEEISQALIAAIQNDGRIFIFGNGGSAADAQHIAAELVGRYKRERRGLPAMALTTDTSNLLSIGNDYGFGHIFTRQVEALVRPGDVVWALSTSGNSPNVIEAVHVARALQAVIIGFTGESGGKLKSLCDFCLCVPHQDSDRIQEMHQLAYHLVCDAVERHIAV